MGNYLKDETFEDTCEEMFAVGDCVKFVKKGKLLCYGYIRSIDREQEEDDSGKKQEVAYACFINLLNGERVAIHCDDEDLTHADYRFFEVLSKKERDYLTNVLHPLYVDMGIYLAIKNISIRKEPLEDQKHFRIAVDFVGDTTMWFPSLPIGSEKYESLYFETSYNLYDLGIIRTARTLRLRK